jgi:hypothetical protein
MPDIKIRKLTEMQWSTCALLIKEYAIKAADHSGRAA